MRARAQPEAPTAVVAGPGVVGVGAPEVVTQSPSAELAFPSGGPAVFAPTVTNRLGRRMTTRAAVPVGTLATRFTG